MGGSDRVGCYVPGAVGYGGAIAQERQKSNAGISLVFPCWKQRREGAWVGCNEGCIVGFLKQEEGRGGEGRGSDKVWWFHRIGY